MEKDQLQPEIKLPPGFRFHPSDEELIVHYLSPKASKNPLPGAIVTEVELYKFNPWELPKKAVFGEEEWYFFTPRDRKYPNGMRPNRMASSGYWKATGTDKPILSSSSAKVIGVKKALVFYMGRPPKGNKTDWIMHEYRLPEAPSSWATKKERSMRLDDWVLCRVKQKTGTPGNYWEARNGLSKEPAVHYHPKLDKRCPIYMGTTSTTAPNVEMVREYLYRDCPLLPFLFGNSQDFPSTDIAISNVSSEGNKNSSQSACMDNINFEANKTSSGCEDNFNIDYFHNSNPTPGIALLNMCKRKRIEENGKDISFRYPINKQTSKDYPIREEISESASKDTTGTVSCSTNQMDRNNSISNEDQVGSMTRYQDLYSLALTRGE